MAGRATYLLDRVRIMLELTRKGMPSKAQLLDQVYVRARCVPAHDGSKVPPYLFGCTDGKLGRCEMDLQSPQENFRKGAMGLLSLVEIGREKAVEAVGYLEKRNIGKVPLGIFRGAENLVEPDAMTVLVRVHPHGGRGEGETDADVHCL